MTVYEVSIEVDAERAADYRAWLAGHVRELLALPGFLEATVHEVEADAPAPERVGLVVHYLLESHVALQSYLREHAPRMRARADEHFAGSYRASRRVLNPLCTLLAEAAGSAATA